MKFEIIVLSVVIIILLIIFYFKKSSTKYTNVKVGNIKIRAEIANDVFKRTKGLMFRKSLPEKDGMLFVFDEENYHSFWMMNMSFPIDIIWINKEKKVVDIVKNAQPCKLICSSYTPKEKAMYVLEVNANFTEKYSIKIGSFLKFDLNS
jgi:uncharacterized membrane protein (UPF0127 family)